MSLTAKQDRFVDEYLVDLNATQAAIRAGYSEKTATMQASRMLTKANVSVAVAKRRKQLADELEVTRERIAHELSQIGFAPLGGEQVKVSDKRRALMDLAKILGYLVDRSEVAGRITAEKEQVELDLDNPTHRRIVRGWARLLNGWEEENE